MASEEVDDFGPVLKEVQESFPNFIRIAPEVAKRNENDGRDCYRGDPLVVLPEPLDAEPGC